MVRNWRREPAGRARRGISAILLLLFVCFVRLEGVVVSVQ